MLTVRNQKLFDYDFLRKKKLKPDNFNNIRVLVKIIWSQSQTSMEISSNKSSPFTTNMDDGDDYENSQGDRKEEEKYRSYDLGERAGADVLEINLMNCYSYIQK